VLEVMGQMPETVLARAELVKFGHACEKSPNLTVAQCWKHPRPMRPQRTSSSHSPAGSPTFDKGSAGVSAGRASWSEAAHQVVNGLIEWLGFCGLMVASAGGSRSASTPDSRCPAPTSSTRAQMQRRPDDPIDPELTRSPNGSRLLLAGKRTVWSLADWAWRAATAPRRTSRGSSTARCDRHTG
jgi:hypothetical protein